MMTLEGESRVANLERRGANLDKGISIWTAEKSRGKDILLHRIKHTLNIQIHNLRERVLGMRLEFLAPCCARIRKEDIHMIRRLFHLSNESVQFIHARTIGGDGNGLRAGALVRERVERGDGFFAGTGFSGSDVDLGAASLEETFFFSFN